MFEETWKSQSKCNRLSDNQFIGFACSEIQNTKHSGIVTQIDLGGIFLPMIRHIENIVTPHSLKKLSDKCTCHKVFLMFDAQQIGEDRIAFELMQIRITVFIYGCLEVTTWVFEYRLSVSYQIAHR